MTARYLIDPPPDWASLATWREHQASLDDLPSDDENVVMAKEDAARMIERIEAKDWEIDIDRDWRRHEAQLDHPATQQDFDDFIEKWASEGAEVAAEAAE